jgi:hypothetical protein
MAASIQLYAKKRKRDMEKQSKEIQASLVANLGKES